MPQVGDWVLATSREASRFTGRAFFARCAKNEASQAFLCISWLLVRFTMGTLCSTSVDGRVGVNRKESTSGAAPLVAALGISQPQRMETSAMGAGAEQNRLTELIGRVVVGGLWLRHICHGCSERAASKGFTGAAWVPAGSGRGSGGSVRGSRHLRPAAC